MKIETDQEIIARHAESVRGRALIELAIVHELLKRLAEAGYKVAIDDGDGEDQFGSEQELVSAAFAVDEAIVHCRKGGKKSSVHLVFGNDGYDVISDYHTSLDAVMDPLEDWIDKAGYVASR